MDNGAKISARVIIERAGIPVIVQAELAVAAGRVDDTAMALPLPHR